MKQDFEIVKSTRYKDKSAVSAGTEQRVEQRIGDIVADNFGQILDIASNICEIEKMKVQSDAVIRQMAESRQTLLAEAEAYAQRKNADTESVVAKMQMVCEMMRDFYQYNTNANLSGEDFSRIIRSIISEMGRL